VDREHSSARRSETRHRAEAHACGDPRGHGHGSVPHAGVLGGEGRNTDFGRLRTTLALTAAMMVAEAVGGFVSGSLALLSDAGHMLTDVVSLVLSMLALWFSSRPADLKRTYGFYRLEILSALVNGMTLLGIAGVVAYEAVERRRHPQPRKVGGMLARAGVGRIVYHKRK
jgi:cobalt-zinc-cadmium efflux system protein